METLPSSKLIALVLQFMLGAKGRGRAQSFVFTFTEYLNRAVSICQLLQQIFQKNVLFVWSRPKMLTNTNDKDVFQPS